ncbi:MAG TPA: histidine decarboxylase [Micromonosporaceae bacterium]|nr:histidine decarboxylase [Micromonosporaceae bacterium]
MTKLVTPTDARLAELYEHLEQGVRYKAGFPGADDIDYSPLWPFLRFELNNIGDPYDDPVFDHHTKQYEREAIDFFADLLRAPTGDRWGYVTSGSTECVQYGLLRARRFYPDGITYFSTAAHYKVARQLHDLRMPAVAVPAGPHGEMSYTDLHEAVTGRADKPAIVLATAGTTMTEAVDNVARITEILRDLAVADRYIHVDAALSGIPLSLLNDADRPMFDFTAGADSVGFSLHKFLATRMPGGMIVSRKTPPWRAGDRVSYTGAADTTVSCSRNGHIALMVWYAIHTLGIDGLRRRADEARETAAYLVDQLTSLNWPVWRHPHAMTVVLETPPARVAATWQLANFDDRWSHYICLPGRGRTQIDRFIADMRIAMADCGVGAGATLPTHTSYADRWRTAAGDAASVK